LVENSAISTNLITDLGKSGYKRRGERLGDVPACPPGGGNLRDGGLKRTRNALTSRGQGAIIGSALEL